MGRTVQCDGFVQGQFQSQGETFSTGLLLGHWGSSRDYIVVSVPTPPEDEDGAASTWADVNADWVAEHARQVQRMVPGGIDVTGVYCIETTNASAPVDKKLAQLARSVAEATRLPFAKRVGQDAARDFVILHYCPATQKSTARTISYPGAPAAPRPAEFKYTNDLISQFVTIRSSVKVDHTIALSPTTDNDASVQDRLERSLLPWISALQSSVAIDAGSGKEIEPYDPNATGKPTPVSSFVKNGEISVNFFMPVDSFGDDSGDVTGKSDAGLSIQGGAVSAIAFVPTKTTAADAVIAVQLDAMRSLWYRCELLAEDDETAHGDQSALTGSAKVSATKTWALPARQTFPVNKVPLCDYLLADEDDSDLQSRAKELLGLDSNDGVTALESAASSKPSTSRSSKGKQAKKSSGSNDNAPQSGSSGEQTGGANYGAIGAGVAAIGALVLGVSQLWN